MPLRWRARRIERGGTARRQRGVCALPPRSTSLPAAAIELNQQATGGASRGYSSLAKGSFGTAFDVKLIFP